MQVTKGYSEPIPTSKIEPFAKIVNGYSSLITLAKSSMLGIRLGSSNILNEKKKIDFFDEEIFCRHWNNARIEKWGMGEVVENPEKIRRQSFTLIHSLK